MIPSHTVTQPAELLPFLFATFPEVKRTKVRQWLKFGAVAVNSQPITRAKFELQPGDVVAIEPKTEERSESVLPTGLAIVFEDASLIVVEKPENMLSMASPTVKSKTAYAYMTEYVQRGNAKSRRRVWIVHRLDRETSGLMVFTKTEEAKRALQAQWQRAEKRYQAIVEGELPASHGVLESDLDESGPFKVFTAPPSNRTRRAVTHYQVMKQNKQLSLVELRPETGRRNQLRVQLADAGCPIVGDAKYEAKTNPAGRLALHASFLQFEHPISGNMLKFSSNLPPDLARLV